MRIGDSIVLISDAGPRDAATALLHVYVEDVDTIYRRALDAGARAVETPAITPDGDRRSIVEDAWGNTWPIATYRGNDAD